MLRRQHAVLALAFLLASASLAQSQQPPSEVQPAPQEHKGETKGQREPSPKNHAAKPEPAPSLLDVISTDGLQRISTYCANNPDSEPNKWLHEKFICDVHVTDLAIAIFSGLLVIVTILLALIGWCQARIIGNTAKRQLRAYILPERAYIKFGKVTSAQIDLKNSGQTPGHDVSIYFSLDIVFGPLTEMPAAPVDPNPESHGVIGSGVNIHCPAQIPRVITQEEITGVQSGKASVYLAGRLSYRDAFGRTQTSDFCFIYGGENGCTPNGAMSPYKDYNKAT